VEIGYWLSSEEHTPLEHVRNAVRAEEAGFTEAMISDHFHPWVDEQGHAPFVWGVLAAIGQATERLRIGTGVTCPTMRIHPAILAQAAATTACLMPGRFFLGVGTGENLNEHILGDRWPAPDERLEMLQEAIDVMRLLWQGGYQTHRGKHYTVDHARVFDLPEQPVEIAVAAAKPNAAETAGAQGDALVVTSADKDVIEKFREAGGSGKPIYGQLSGCYAKSKDDALKLVLKQWPNAGLKGAASQELPMPEHFEQLAENVRAEDIEGSMPLGPDPEPWLKQIEEYRDAGITHVYLHQIGTDQESFVEFAQRELLAQVAS
jgi:G6PDH family F420-dependent oxidoreductase